MDGVLVIDKPEGPTSHDVVSVARRSLGVRAMVVPLLQAAIERSAQTKG